MDREAKILKQARLGPDISLREMAELVGLDVPHIEALEAGTAEASTDQLDRYARVFGLSLRRFLAGGAVTAPPTMLFRSLHAEGRSFEDLLETGASSVLGEFLRCTADVAELETALGETGNRIAKELDGLAAEAVQDVPNLYRQAERLALDVRNRLQLGLDPVPSMIELVQDRLGVPLFWVGPDDLDPDIDGASAYAPNAAILINLVGGAECWWRSRMTLAHELCHVLFDLNQPGPDAQRAFLFSPHRGEVMDGTRRRGPRLPKDLEQIEQRANVFAVHFLAPPEAVRTTVGPLSPTSDEVINAVCRRFQIGRVTAVNQITNTYRLSKEERLSMVARSPSDVLPKQHPDAVVRPGLRAGRVQDLAVRALTEGRLGNARARQLLGLSSSDPFPLLGTLSEEQRAPLHTPEQRARLAAQRYLTERADLGGYYVARVLREGDQFRIAVEYVDGASWNAPLARGYLILSAGFEVLEQDSHLELPAKSG